MSAGPGPSAISPDNSRLRSLVVGTLVALALVGVVAAALTAPLATTLVVAGLATVIVGLAVGIGVLLGRAGITLVDGELRGRTPRFTVRLDEVRRVEAAIEGLRTRYYVLRLHTAASSGGRPAATIDLRGYRPDEVEALFLAELTRRAGVVVDPSVTALREVWRSQAR